MCTAACYPRVNSIAGHLSREERLFPTTPACGRPWHDMRWTAFGIFAVNAILMVAAMAGNNQAFRLMLDDPETACLATLLLDGMPIVWLGVYFLEFVVICSPALWGSGYAPTAVIVATLTLCHGFAIGNAVWHSGAVFVDSFPTCEDSVFLPAKNRSQPGSLVFLAIRSGAVPIVAGLWRYAVHLEVD